MIAKSSVAALVVASTFMFAAGNADASSVVIGGEAKMTFTADFDALGLGSNWDSNADGNPERNYVIRASPGLPYTYTFSDGSQREFIARDDNGSIAIGDDNAVLKLAGPGAYLYATDSNGDQIETFDPVKIFNFRPSDAEVAAGITAEMREINYIPTADPNVFTDYRDPTTTYTLTDAQLAFLKDDGIRTCCAHTLSSFAIDTLNMTVDGVIDSIAERDINQDGVIDDLDEFHLFDLKSTSVEGVFDLALTETMSQFLNFGFSKNGFADSTDFEAKWSGPAGGLGLAGGDIIGKVAYSYELAAVPVPAALPLLAGGLGLIGFVGRRRKQKQA